MKQNSQARGLKPWLIYASFFAFAALALLAWLQWGKKGQSSPRNFRQHALMLRKALEERILPKNEWFTLSFSALQPPGGALRADAAAFVTSEWWQYDSSLKAYSKQSDLAQLSELFSASVPGAVTQTQSGGLNIPLVWVKTEVLAGGQSDIRKKLKITFYGPNQTALLKTAGLLISEPGQVAYQPGDEIIFVPAITHPNPVMRDAMIFHELVHVRQIRQTTQFGQTPQITHDAQSRPTDQAADQEVEAHTLGGMVFDIGTLGEYYRKIRKVVAANNNAASPIDLVLKVTAQDFEEIDLALGRPATYELASRTSQYEFDLAREWTNIHVPQQRRLEAMRDFYRELFKPD